MGRTADIDLAICELAARTLSVVHASQLRLAGISRDVVATRVARGWMAPVIGGSYAVGPTCRAPSFDMRCMAGVLHAGREARIDGVTGASLLDLWNRRVDQIQIVMPSHATALGNSGEFRFRRQRTPWAPDEVVHVGPLPVGSALHLAARCAERMSPWQVAFVIHRAIYRGLASLDEFSTFAHARPRRRGNATLQLAIGLVRDGSVGTRSTTEDAALEGLIGAGIAPPIVNTRGAMGMPRDEPDFVFPTVRRNVECDGGHHDEPAQARDDRLRDAEAVDRGWGVLRFRARDYWRRRAFVTREVVRFVRGGPVELESGTRTLLVR